MRIILIGVALAALIASPLSAQPQTTKRQSHAAYRELDEPARKPRQPTLFPVPTGQGLCSTAPSFCPGYHGSNGA